MKGKKKIYLCLNILANKTCIMITGSVRISVAEPEPIGAEVFWLKTEPN